MFKRFVSIIIIISIIFGMTSISLGLHELSPSLLINDKAISLEDDIYIGESGQLMVPLRQVAEALNYKVLWNNVDQSIELKDNSNLVSLQIGNNNVSLNNKNLNLSLTPIIKNHKTYLPVEFFSNVLDLIVGWDSEQYILKLNRAKENTEEYFQISKDKQTTIELQNYINALVEKENFNGSILVAKDNEVLLSGGYGFANIDLKTLNKSATSFAIGSVTKQFTAMAIMQLVEKDLINLQDKLSKYIPEISHGDLITIENLLTHTSGLANFTDSNQFFLMGSEDINPMDMVDLINNLPLEYTPGDGFQYSNTNYLLLGMIVENVSSLSLEKYLDVNIFKPLNMNNTGTSYGINNEIHDATAHTGYIELMPIDDSILLKKVYGAGNLYSTVEDLYRWDRALNTEQIIKKDSLDKIFHGYVEVTDSIKYGLAWMIEEGEKGKHIFHGGNTLGFTSNISRYVDEDLTVIVLSNNGYYYVQPIIDDLSSIVLNKEYSMPLGLVEIVLDNYDIYDKYVGKYHFLQGSYLEIARLDNKLYAQVTGQGAFEIYPRAIDDFFAKIIDANILFVEEDGHVDILIFEQLGMIIECYRAE